MEKNGKNTLGLYWQELVNEMGEIQSKKNTRVVARITKRNEVLLINLNKPGKGKIFGCMDFLMPR